MYHCQFSEQDLAEIDGFALAAGVGVRLVVLGLRPLTMVLEPGMAPMILKRGMRRGAFGELDGERVADAVDPADAAAELDADPSVESDEDDVGESDEDGEESASGPAHAIPGALATAVPIPSTIASAPMRPMQLA